MNKTKQGFFPTHIHTWDISQIEKQNKYTAAIYSIAIHSRIPLSLDLGQRHSWNKQSNRKSRSGRDTAAQ